MKPTDSDHEVFVSWPRVGVTLALLVNGAGLVQAFLMTVKKGCCAEMAVHETHEGDGGLTGTRCPSPTVDCDTACLMRCHANNLLPSVALTLPQIHLPSPSPPLPATGARPSTDPGPGLRAPIFV